MTARAQALAPWIILAAAVLPARAAAQLASSVPVPPAPGPPAFVPQPQYYQLTTDAYDARALWVQPAGLVKLRESSISALLTANQQNGLSVGQYGLTVSSGGLALGWQHDRLPNGAYVNAYAVGLAGGSAHISIGADHRWYKGTTTKDGSWDLGFRYQAMPPLELSAVWRDLGSPVIEGGSINATLVPGAAIRLLDGRAQAGVDWEILTHGWSTSALRAGAGFRLPLHLAANVRAEFDGRLSARSFAVALSWSHTGARVAAFDATQRSGTPDEVGIWGAAVSTPLRRRRFGG